MQNTVFPLLPDWLTRCRETRPDQLAVRCGQTCWSFAELAHQAEHLARQLRAAGVHAGSRVALLAPNGLAYVACVHALTRLDAILVPLNIRLTQQELCWQLADVRADLLVWTPDLDACSTAIRTELPALPQATLQTLSSTPEHADIHLFTTENQPFPVVEIAPHTLIDLATTQVILYTSGTTGKPKGVIITYGMQWWNAVGSVLNLDHREDDRWLLCLPLFHIGGLSILMRSVIYGDSIILLEKFDEHAVNRAIQRDGVTIISVVAVMLQRMLTALNEEEERERRYPASLRCVLLGGGPAPRPLLERCAELGIPVSQTYGLTESCSQAVTLAPADALRKLGSAGRPLAPVRLQIRREGHPLPAGEVGVIHLQGPTITPGYADRPDATAEVLRDGWLSTGDLGYLDEEGYLFVLDRRADLIVSGGENIYPAEIESVLLGHPAVLEAGVCGQPDPQWGQVPVAFIKTRNDRPVENEALFAHARRYLARYKLPRAIYRIEELPRNSSGKLLRRELPRLLEQYRHDHT